MFILVLVIFFTFIKNNPKFKGESLSMNFYTPHMEMTLFSFSEIEDL